MASRVLISMLCLAIAGCGGDVPPAQSAAKPATVTAPVKEAQLTTVTLSEDAERRLAIKMETVAQRAVPRTRTIGGEIMAPSGTALAITAPVAGTLQATTAVPTAGLPVLRGQTRFAWCRFTLRARHRVRCTSIRRHQDGAAAKRPLKSSAQSAL